MLLAESLQSLVNSMTTEVKLISSFAKDVDEALSKKTPLSPSKDFTKEDFQELLRVRKFINESLESAPKSKKGTVTLKLDTQSERVGSYLMQVAGEVKYGGFLAEMSLGYLISHLEAYFKDYVLTVLAADPRMLRSSVTLTYDELATHKSLRSVWLAAAEREAEALGYGSIDDSALYFKKRFSVDISSFSHWESLRESVYRRNLIVHNRGRLNAIYKRKVGYKGKESRLTTDLRYVASTSKMLIDFFKFVHQLMSERGARTSNPFIERTLSGKPASASRGRR